MLRPLALVATALLISACATPEQKAERTIARYGPYCEKLGFTKNSDPWRDCILKEDARATAIIFSK